MIRRKTNSGISVSQGGSARRRFKDEWVTGPPGKEELAYRHNVALSKIFSSGIRRIEGRKYSLPGDYGLFLREESLSSIARVLGVNQKVAKVLKEEVEMHNEVRLVVLELFVKTKVPHRPPKRSKKRLGVHIRTKWDDFLDSVDKLG